MRYAKTASVIKGNSFPRRDATLIWTSDMRHSVARFRFSAHNFRQCSNILYATSSAHRQQSHIGGLWRFAIENVSVSEERVLGFKVSPQTIDGSVSLCVWRRSFRQQTARYPPVSEGVPQTIDGSVSLCVWRCPSDNRRPSIHLCLKVFPQTIDGSVCMKVSPQTIYG